ncbi:UNVERIFIED_CONTAM: hypothetical protein HDU68_006399 [Siphonaria sp. JEL0065]|nr:hypothetical protein HDU68_006399 [Siphonaria sp. JEL0065]
MTISKIPVTIVTDTLCPWCYIGKKRFEAAITQYKQIKGDSVEFQVSYEPFQLDPTLPKKGINKLQHYYTKFGKSRFDAMNVHVKNAGASVGINFSFTEDQLVGNSFDSHRLIKYAGTLSHESQDKVINSLYRAYFEEGKNLADVETLVEAGRAGGVDEKVVREQIFGADLLLKETQVAVDGIQSAGISGVPFFIIGNKFAISGGQEPETFIKVFDKVIA